MKEQRPRRSHKCITVSSSYFEGDKEVHYTYAVGSPKGENMVTQIHKKEKKDVIYFKVMFANRAFLEIYKPIHAGYEPIVM